MTTALQLCDRTFRLVQKTTRLPNADESSSILEYLNGMLDSWRNDALLVHAYQDESLPMVAGTSSYTIGPSGSLNTTRPIKIESAFLRVSDIDYPVDILNDKQWAEIPDKTTTSDIVSAVYYEPTMATGTLKVWPVPSATNTLHLTTWVPLASMSLATTVTLPPGYEDALVYNLALRIWDEFGDAAGPSAVTATLARETLSAIKSTNSRPIIQKGGAHQFGRRRGSMTVAELFG